LGSRVFRVGTRGSRLSLIQTQLVLNRLRGLNQGLEFEVVKIRTLGDWEQTRSLFYLDRKGVFEREIDEAIFRGAVDFGVHSLKDVPVEGREGLVLAAVPPRGSPYDALVARGSASLWDLPRGAVIGTSSLRRAAELRAVRPDLRVRPIRGNVDTRLAKLDAGEYDALVLAEEGLRRLGLEDRVSQRLLPPSFLPAAGQGALGVVAREDDSELLGLLKQIEDPPSRAEVTAERALISILGGGCRVPIGALARVEGERLSLEASILSIDGGRSIHHRAEDVVTDPLSLAQRVARALIKQGAKELMDEWRTSDWGLASGE
jgi:hydroxymethylbilane synthase